MKRVLVVEHVEHEGLGTIGAMLDREGFRADFLKVYEKARFPRSFEGYSALIVMGGPMGVYEEKEFPFITWELRLIESALKQNAPILGVCLGSQLLAKAAGARVYKGKAKEIGWYKARLTPDGRTDMVFMGLPDELTVFQWHGDTFDVPNGASNLVSSSLFPNQVIRVGKNAYGIQFHLEVTAGMVEEWVKVNAGELKDAGFDGKGIIKATKSNIEGLHALGRVALARFLRLID